MAELNTACCTPSAQQTCCEPDAKASCCGDQHAPGCGCAAGADPILAAASAKSPEDVRETVRAKYAEAARLAAGGEFHQARAVESESGRTRTSMAAARPTGLACSGPRCTTRRTAKTCPKRP